MQKDINLNENEKNISQFHFVSSQKVGGRIPNLLSLTPFICVFFLGLKM